MVKCCKQEEVAKLVTEMEQNDIIETSTSLWTSPIVLVRKKDGSTRFCVDYRQLNDITKKDSHSLLRIDDTLETLSGHQWILNKIFDKKKVCIYHRTRTMAI